MSGDASVSVRSGSILPLLIISLIFLLTPDTARSAEDPADKFTNEIVLSPVIVDGRELFRVRGVSAYPAKRRAAEIAAQIEAVAANDTLSPNELTVNESDHSSVISLGRQEVLTIFDADAQLEQLDRKTLALAYITRIGEAIIAYRHDRTRKYLLRYSSYAAAATIGLGLFLWLIRSATRRISRALDQRIKTTLEGLETQSKRVVNANDVWTALRGMHQLAWTIIFLIAVIVYLNYVLQLFPWTRYVGMRLLDMVINPLRTLGEGFLGILPKLIFLVVFIFITRYAIKVLRLFFAGLARGSVSVRGFEHEWSWPTFRLVRIVVIAFAVVIAYPYIPGSDLDAFKGVSIFLGVIFSLGSTSVISNMVAGYSLIYRRAFRTGDRVKIEEHVGDVIQARLLVTHLRTPFNEEVIIPNSTVLNSSIMNFSTLAREGRLIVPTSVGIGYETPWRQVEAMLLEAAARTEGVAENPQPFVMQKELGDFCVTYSINVYCSDAQGMARLSSGLRRNILDVFNEYGVQIMTPAYESDPARPKTVPRDQWYAAPAKPETPDSDGPDRSESTP